MSLNIYNFVAWAENEICRTDDSSDRTFYEPLTFRVSGKFLYSLLPLSMYFFLLFLLKLQPCYQTFTPTMTQISRRPRSRGCGLAPAESAAAPPGWSSSPSRLWNYRFPQAQRSLVGNDAMNCYPLGGIDFDLPPLVSEPV